MNRFLAWILKLRGYSWGDVIEKPFDKMIWRLMK